VVPQGTSEVVVLWNWTMTPLASFGDPVAAIQTAHSTQWIELGRVTPGEPMHWLSSNEDNDLPHQRVSAWQFRITFSPSPGGIAIVDGRLTLDVVALRGLEIPLHPGHPDLWGPEDRLPLLDDTAQVSASTLGGPNVCADGCLARHTPGEEQIVPFDSSLVEVHLTSTGEIPSSSVGLEYHGSDTREFTRIQHDRMEGMTKVYQIPVQGNGDGPYATKSLWGFRTFIEEPVLDSVYYGEYRIEAWAVR
jgi:hypothetical protein